MLVKGKTALITASAQGIGLACAHTLAKQGAKVYLADYQIDKAKTEAENLKKEGFEAEALFFDAGDVSTYKTMLDDVFKKEKTLDILVNNFGTTFVEYDKDLINCDDDHFFKVLHMNIGSVFHTCKCVIPNMIANGGGSIINISSIGGVIPDILQTAYGTNNKGEGNNQSVPVPFAKLE